MLSVGRVAVVQRANEGPSRKSRLPLEHLTGVGAGCGLVAELGCRRRQESVVRVVRSGELAVGGDRVSVSARGILRPAEMAPKTLRMIGIEPHRPANPRGARAG